MWDMKTGRVILVCGGRRFGYAGPKMGRTLAGIEKARFERHYVYDQLSIIHGLGKIGKIIHGKAKGADTAAMEWARAMLIPNKGYPAAWDDLNHPAARVLRDRYGRRYNANAGPIRNQEMLDLEPDIELVVGFPGGSGTKDMLDRAHRAGIEVLAVEPPCYPPHLR